ncbi:MAG TPA: matrixin family metalloprotease [Gammaproteobacteria bacterium]|nr:matrixin family metalloprotease [Gammaproteobacteria bacterium]
MRRRAAILVACGLLLVFIVLSMTRDEEYGRDWLSWLPGQSRHVFAHVPCGIPVHYALAAVDPGFGLDRDTVMAALVEAVSLWQPPSGPLLFLESDHALAIQVSLRYDERQQAANTRSSLRHGLERDRGAFEDDEAMLLQWGERIDAARASHERAAAALAARARAYEQDVTAWNAGRGERTETRRQALETESALLRDALADLERAGLALNADVEAYNRRAADLRQRADDFQARVARYNAASSASPVESGRYSYAPGEGRRIEVYRAESFDELVLVLAHELGHALGIGHVDEPGAVMHAMLHDGGLLQSDPTRPLELSAADKAALVAVCGQRLRP